MERFRRSLVRIAHSERGQDMVEYAMVAMFISAVIVFAVVAVDLPSAFVAWAEQVAATIVGA